MREALSETDEKRPHVWVDVQDMKILDCKDMTAAERHNQNDEAQAVGEFFLQWMTEEAYEKALNGIPEGEWIFVWGHTEQKWFILNQKGVLIGEAGNIGEAESRVNMRGMEMMEVGISGEFYRALPFEKTSSVEEIEREHLLHLANSSHKPDGPQEMPI